jgi:hypothetical protein
MSQAFGEHISCLGYVSETCIWRRKAVYVVEHQNQNLEVMGSNYTCGWFLFPTSTMYTGVISCYNTQEAVN